MDDLEVAIRIDEDLIGIKTQQRFELTQGVRARLKYTPEFSLFKALVFFLPSHYFLPERDLWILEEGVYLIGS
jgi:hypothetical protein